MGLTIVLVNEWYSENMGYIENCLPKALTNSSNQIHLITSTAQVYYNNSAYNKVYQNYHGEKFVPVGCKKIDGYFLHRLPFKQVFGKTYLLNLKSTLKQIKPDIVHYLDSPNLITTQLCILKIILKYKFFLSIDKLYSIYPFLQKENKEFLKTFIFFLSRFALGRLTSIFVSKAYPLTPDAKEISIKYLGIPSKKIKLHYLGTDADIFYPQKSLGIIDNEKKKIRN